MSAVSAVAPSPVQTGTVEANQFNFWYGENQALHEINLTIRPRSVTALIGPSGCGKSTFLRSFNRLNDVIPDTKHTGQIRLDGEDVYAAGNDVVNLRQRVGTVFQRSNPFPRFIFENVGYGQRINGRPTRP